MKKYLIVSIFLVIGLVSNSQILISILLGDKLNSGKMEFGLDGGLNLSNIKNLQGANSLLGFNLGFYFDIKLFRNPAWMLNTGVIVKSPMGANDLPVYPLNDPTLDSAFSGGSVTRKIRYFNVPVLIKYKFENRIYLKGGVQFGLRYKAFDEFKNSVNSSDDLIYKLKTKGDFHPLDAGLAFGAGYSLIKGNGMNIGFQYYYGLVDIRIDDSTPSQFNRVLYFTAGIPIGKGKKSKQTDETGQQ